MKLVANIQLTPTKADAQVLRQTLETCNKACTEASRAGFEKFGMKVRQFNLQKVVYGRMRDEFGLTAQAAIRSIAKVADAYATARGNKEKLEEPVRFRKHAAQPFDDRIFRFLPDGKQVSIWTLEGRKVIPFVCGERQKALLVHRKGEVDLMLVRGKWYLAVVCDIPDPEAIEFDDVLGVDFGIVNLAYDSDGRAYTGEAVEAARLKYNRRRRCLQKCGSKAAKRRLKKLSGKEARFKKHTNHCISKELVANAERSQRALAIEDLTGIRSRTKVRKAQRNRHAGWSFAQLGDFATYKACRFGVPLVRVPAPYTSLGCPECGFICKGNRPTQGQFSCKACGYEAPADFVGARNLRMRGLQALGANLVSRAPEARRVVRPSEMLFLGCDEGQKPPLERS
jgi:putative transposase